MDRIKTIEILQNMVANAEGDEFIALRTAIDSVIQVRAFEEADRWIPADASVPENDDKVLCQTVTKKGVVNMVIGYYMGGRWCCGMNSNVVAWQPLPKPYGGVK